MFPQFVASTRFRHTLKVKYKVQAAKLKANDLSKIKIFSLAVYLKEKYTNWKREQKSAENLPTFRIIIQFNEYVGREDGELAEIPKFIVEHNELPPK